jgi:hypothetical protein
MNAVMTLLNDKNEHLHKFLQLNETELINFMNGNFDNLEVFYQSRETILDLIRCIDGLVEVALKDSPSEGSQIAPEEKRDFLKTLSRKNDLITQILAQDLQILSVIEQAKSDIIKELRQVQAARKAVGAYKSGETKNQLDEEA